MKIAIVGAGFSGLEAAHRLNDLGHETTIFEARDRVGGRCHTVREGDAVFEAGGEWIDADHDRVLKRMLEFSQNLLPAPEEPRGIICKGEWISEDNLWEAAESDAVDLENNAVSLSGKLVFPGWENEGFYDLDDETLEGLVAQICQSEVGKWWVSAQLRSDEGDDPERIGLLGWLLGYRLYLDREGAEMSAFRFENGASALAEQMAVGLDIRLNTKVSEIHQDVDGVTVDGHPFDLVVITVPPSVTRQIRFKPSLPDTAHLSQERCEMSRAIKLTWQFKNNFWNGTLGNGNLHWDGKLQQTWDAGLGSAPILSAYICGKEAVDILDSGDPLEVGLAELEQIFPTARGEFVKGWVSDWIHDPFAKGAFSHLAPGYVFGGMQYIAEPVGRVYFAGEHTAKWTGFIEGALESGERVAQEIHETWS